MRKLSNAQFAALGIIINGVTGRGKRGVKAVEFGRPTLNALQDRGLVDSRRGGTYIWSFDWVIPTDAGREAYAKAIRDATPKLELVA